MGGMLLKHAGRWALSFKDSRKRMGSLVMAVIFLYLARISKILSLSCNIDSPMQWNRPLNITGFLEYCLERCLLEHYRSIHENKRGFGVKFRHLSGRVYVCVAHIVQEALFYVVDWTQMGPLSLPLGAVEYDSFLSVVEYCYDQKVIVLQSGVSLSGGVFWYWIDG